MHAVVNVLIVGHRQLLDWLILAVVQCHDWQLSDIRTLCPTVEEFLRIVKPVTEPVNTECRVIQVCDVDWQVRQLNRLSSNSCDVGRAEWPTGSSTWDIPPVSVCPSRKDAWLTCESTWRIFCIRMMASRRRLSARGLLDRITAATSIALRRWLRGFDGVGTYTGRQPQWRGFTCACIQTKKKWPYRRSNACTLGLQCSQSRHQSCLLQRLTDYLMSWKPFRERDE